MGRRRGRIRDERFLIFDCGAVGDGGHGHYDPLSFEAMAGGRPLVVDPGRYTYAEGEPNLRHWFKGTAAHNTVVVDGLDQVPYRRGKPLKGTQSEARFVERLSAPGLDVLDGEARSVAYDAVHRRQVVFVADAYWLILDTLTDAVAHRYDLRFHLDSSADHSGGHHPRRRRMGRACAPGSRWSWPARPSHVSKRAGWRPPMGSNTPRRSSRFVAAGLPSARFATLLMPRSAARGHAGIDLRGPA